jgi:Tti2 family
MQYLDTHVFLEKEEIEPSVLLGIIAYTDIQDPWTTEATKHAAEQLLARHRDQLLSHDFIIDHVLAGYIRPLFSGSKPATVTPQGRKAINPVPKVANHPSDQDSANKPWKSQDVSSLTTFRWAILNMDVSNMYHS